MKRKILILGGTGMLGSMVADYLARDPDLIVSATIRDQEEVAHYRQRLADVNWVVFDTATPDFHWKLDLINDHDWVINTINFGRPLILNQAAFKIERAIWINAMLPHLIARQARESGTRVLQIASECVYSGKKGHYMESDPHDSPDPYGQSKSLGEVPDEHVFHLRCALIGPESHDKKYLLSWFLDQPEHGEIHSFIHSMWNGLTTLHYAKICQTIIKSEPELPNKLHLVPADTISISDLIQLLAKHYQRSDLHINPSKDRKDINRTLATEYPDLNQELWKAAGYTSTPTIVGMVRELAAYDFRLTQAGSSPN